MALHVNSIALTISFNYMFCLEEKFLKNLLLEVGVEMERGESKCKATVWRAEI